MKETKKTKDLMIPLCPNQDKGMTLNKRGIAFYFQNKHGKFKQLDLATAKYFAIYHPDELFTQHFDAEFQQWGEEISFLRLMENHSKTFHHIVDELGLKLTLAHK